MASVTQARAMEYFNYDPETGHLKFEERGRDEFKSVMSYGWHRKRIGTVAGAYTEGGYRKVLIDGKYYTAHKIAWLIMTGEMVKYPDFEIDHINGDPSDNRWCNLRKVTKSENQRNARMRKNNASGVAGVNVKRQKGRPDVWVARIWNGPRHVHLGTFQELRDAAIARKAAERVLGFTRTHVPAPEASK